MTGGYGIRPYDKHKIKQCHKVIGVPANTVRPYDAHLSIIKIKSKAGCRGRQPLRLQTKIKYKPQKLQFKNKREPATEANSPKNTKSHYKNIKSNHQEYKITLQSI